jgi:hypothetical protein
MSLAYLLQDKTIVTVSGAHSGIGKTLLAESILRVANNFAAVKITIEDFFTAVSFDDASIMVPGKDTFRLKNAGAAQVVWVRTPEQNLVDSMEQALSVLGCYNGLLIEGNRIMTYIKPDLSFFVYGGGIETIKPSRLYALRNAQVIINNIRDKTADCQQTEKTLHEINAGAAVLSINLADTDTLQPLLMDMIKQRLGAPLLRESAA